MLRKKFRIIRDPLNGFRWQVRVTTYYPDGTSVEGDAGEPCDTFNEALTKEQGFIEDHRREFDAAVAEDMAKHGRAPAGNPGRPE